MFRHGVRRCRETRHAGFAGTGERRGRRRTVDDPRVDTDAYPLDDRGRHRGRQPFLTGRVDVVRTVVMVVMLRRSGRRRRERVGSVGTVVRMRMVVGVEDDARMGGVTRLEIVVLRMVGVGPDGLGIWMVRMRMGREVGGCVVRVMDSGGGGRGHRRRRQRSGPG